MFLVWLSLASPVALAGDEASESVTIKEIRKNCSVIDSNKTYGKVQIDVMDKSVEGGVAIGYFDRNDLKKITEKLYGEMGNWTSEYYFDDGNLIFVFIQNRQYKRPQTVEEAIEKGFGPVYRTENARCYFSGDKLIRKLVQWFDNAGNLIPSGGPEYNSLEISEIDLVSGAEELKKRIKNKRRT